MGAIEQTRVVDCAADRERLWAPLADTNRFNLAIGIQPIHAAPLEGGAARYLINQRLAGFDVTYEERPFEWRVPDYWSITRVFRTGPVQVLRPGLLLSVARVAFLFTDLRGSTTLYARHGDAGAYRFIQDHFDVLREAIEGGGGAVVKTIGDAVMAAFASDERAVRAALACQRRFAGLVASRAELEGTALRAGVHAGPCFAVTSNGLLDYFGMTVNTAERLQSAAGDGELVMTAELADTAAVAGWLAGTREVARMPMELKGLPRPLNVVRLAAV